jgi:O-antigen biosynthesis protein WbqP
MYKIFFKRLIDIVVSFIAILLLAPLFIIVALIIYVQDGANPLFTQKRVGLFQKEFILMKFRSMPINTANVVSTEVSTLKITTFGKFIRRSNLDEIPQLINILKGDMSLVGPRPSLVTQEDLIQIRKDLNVYSCRPGLTGLAQVNAYDYMPSVKKAFWDGKYANNLTFLTDFKIIMSTFVYLTKKPPTY